MSQDRVEAFSDGVFAVALTLLILDVRLPEIQSGSTFGAYLVAMTPVLPKMGTFALSFAVIANQWVSHHYYFRQLTCVPLGLVWLNNLFLLWICFLPFPTALLGSHPLDLFPIVLFAANSLCMALTIMTMRVYSTRHGLFIPEVAASGDMGPQHSFPAIILFSLAIPLAFVSHYFALVCFAAVPLLYFMPNFIRARKP